MKNTIIIKLYDDENYIYPLIEIKEGFLKLFQNRLKEYQKDEEYNIDDFLKIIKKQNWFLREININEEIYF